MKPGIQFLAVVTALALAAPAGAQPHAYPAQNQGRERQQKDEAACMEWAVQQSGFDPARSAPPPTAKPQQVTGSGARLKGAAVGGLIGGVSGGDGGEGALAGAAVGGVTRRVRNRRAADAANEANNAAYANARASYDRAWSACLTGKGYTVR